MPLLQLDGDSVGGLIGGILLRVYRGAGHANVVRLRGSLVVQVKDHAVEDVLVRLPLLARLVVDAEDAHVFVLELDLVVPGVHRHRIEFGYRCWTCGRAFQVDLENANRVIAHVFGDIGSARWTPANVATVEFDPSRLIAFLAGHHAVVEVDQQTIRDMSVLGYRRRPRLERRHNYARLGRVESRRDRGGGGGGLGPPGRRKKKRHRGGWAGGLPGA